MTVVNYKPANPGSRPTRLPQWLIAALLISLAVLAIVAHYHIVSKGTDHAIDFYSYYRSGQVIWQGLDPYQVALADQPPGILPLPGDPIPADWRAIPSNTAPVLLLVALLARLPWEPALALWTIVNLGLVLLNGALVVRLFGGKFLSARGLLLVLVFALLVATREVIETGQTTLLIFVFMLMALMMGQRHPVAGGIWLGLALSKISLAFPAALFFLYKRWFRGLFIAIVVQLLGFALMAVIGKTSPFDTGLAYLKIVLLHNDLPGYHLMSGILHNAGQLAVPIVLLGSIGLWGLLAVWFRLRRPAAEPYSSAAALVLFSIIMQWNLLTFYHRRYDNAVNILFIAMVVLWVNSQRRLFRITTLQQRLVNTVALISTVVWIVPLYQVMDADAYKALYNLCSLAALAISVWLLFRIPQHDEADELHRP